MTGYRLVLANGYFRILCVSCNMITRTIIEKKKKKKENQIRNLRCIKDEDPSLSSWTLDYFAVLQTVMLCYASYLITHTPPCGVTSSWPRPPSLCSPDNTKKTSNLKNCKLISLYNDVPFISDFEKNESVHTHHCEDLLLHCDRCQTSAQVCTCC